PSRRWRRYSRPVSLPPQFVWWSWDPIPRSSSYPTLSAFDGFVEDPPSQHRCGHMFPVARHLRTILLTEKLTAGPSTCTSTNGFRAQPRATESTRIRGASVTTWFSRCCGGQTRLLCKRL